VMALFTGFGLLHLQHAFDLLLKSNWRKPILSRLNYRGRALA